jgi:IS4 transposase
VKNLKEDFNVEIREFKGFDEQDSLLHHYYYKVKSFNDQCKMENSDRQKKIFFRLVQMQSARISIVILQFTALTAYWVMVLRLTLFVNVPTLISMLLAILTLFVASIETMIDS